MFVLRCVIGRRAGLCRVALFAAAATALLAGCATPPSGSAPTERDTLLGTGRRAPVSDNIVEIVPFYQEFPWVKDNEGRYIGLTARVYFRSADTDRGVFVPGTITGAIYGLSPRPEGTYAREKLHEWKFGRALADLFRVTEPAKMGESYGLFLRWPPELDLRGREIEVVFGYERLAGQTVSGVGKRFRVPYAGTVAPQRPTTAPVPATAPAATRTPTSRPARGPG
ncbi:MAG: hypothetical protein AB1716_08200 [Planctomycetota bacterium]